MKDSQQAIVSRLRAKYTEELTRLAGSQRRVFSPEFKRRLLSDARSHGLSDSALAEGLGIGQSVLLQWKKKEEADFPKPGMFRKLEIEPDVPGGSSLGPYLEGKSGVRAFGLSLNQMAELLRCL
jgi:hypothetical protein